MVKQFENNHVFQHPWNIVSSAFWRKYPSEFSPHIGEIDSYDRKIDDNGNLITHRVIMSFGVSLPSWVRSLIQADVGFTAETTVVNAAEKKMVIRSRTVTGNSIFSVDETCVYAPHSSNPSWTEYKQEATIRSYVPMVSCKMERKIHETMSDKAKFGVKAVEKVCDRIATQGFRSLFTEFKKPVTSSPSHSSTIADLQHFAEDLAEDLAADLAAAASIPAAVLSESSA